MEISYRIVDAGITVVRLEGRLDATTKIDVKNVLQQLLEKGPQPKIVLDLGQVRFIDSSGLAALVSGLRLAREKGGNIALCDVQPQAHTVFHLTMLDRIFSIHPTYMEAAQSLI